MLSVRDTVACSGCSACTHRCPRHCLTMQADSEGFLRPVFDETNCIHCDRCEQVCPVLHPQQKVTPLHVYSGQHNNADTVYHSASGGVFGALAEYCISQGGVVFGARFDKDWQVVIGHSETLEGLAPLRNSKYVQADPADSFLSAERYLKTGRQVLYAATSCLIAGLLRYLNHDYSKLITVDLCCKGVPSPAIWQRYLREEIHPPIRELSFRDKNKGWRKTKYLRLKSDTKAREFDERRSAFYRAFLKDLINRPSCTPCSWKHGRSGADITLGDFWKIEKWTGIMDDDRGLNIVYVHSPRGEKFLRQADCHLEEFPVLPDRQYNWHYHHSNTPHRCRKLFFVLQRHLPVIPSVRISLFIDKILTFTGYRYQLLRQHCKTLLPNYIYQK